jgi:ribosome-associated protein
LRNEDESTILSYLTPQQGAKKQMQLMRWVDRMIDQGDPIINEFSKVFNASERHTLRQHVLRIHRDIKQQVSEEELEASKRKFVNYVQQVALLSDQG